jgi:hypothetical protein
MSNSARILAQATEALQAGQVARAWVLAEPLLSLTARDPEIASFWLTLLRAAPERPEQPARVAQVLGDWPDDAPLVIRACDAWIRAAELTPLDEPAPPGGAAEQGGSCTTASGEIGGRDRLRGRARRWPIGERSTAASAEGRIPSPLVFATARAPNA